MEAGSISNLFQGQLDYVFFFQGLAFFLISVVCLFFRGQPHQRLPWLWLGLFGLTQGLAAWTQLLAVSLGQQSHAAGSRRGVKNGVADLSDRIRPGRIQPHSRSGWRLVAADLIVDDHRSGRFKRLAWGFRWRVATPWGWWAACGPLQP